MKFLRAIVSLLRFDRTNWTALALCVIAAAIFWTFNALNKDYSTNLALPLRVDFDEARYALAEAIPAKLTVNVNGNGWELLRKSLDQKTSQVTIFLERPAEVHRIPGSTLAPQVVSQLGTLKLNFVVLDTLRISIQEKVTRRLKLAADMSNIRFRQNMGRISPVVIFPDSIILEGPASYINPLPDTLLIQVPRRLINADYREILEVRMDQSEFIKRDPPVAEISFDVGPLRELSLRLPLTLAMKSPGLTVDRDTVTCVFAIPQRDQVQFSADSTTLTALVPGVALEKGDSAWIRPRLNGMPPYSIIVRMDSVLLKRKF